jgi:hypothetical protein
MPVRRVDPADKRQLTDFIRMERTLLHDQPLFVGELDSDVRKRLSRQSEFSKEWDLALFANDRARCVAIINPLWQSSQREPQTGHIGWFAAAPDSSADAVEVLAAAEDWLGSRGMTRAIAPFNGNAFMGMGVLADLSEPNPMFPVPWTPPYYETYFTDAGYAPAYPMWLYDVDFEYERHREFTRRALESPECRLRQFDKKCWDEEVETLRVLWNEGFSAEWEFQQFTAEEFSEFFKELKPTLDPRMVLIAEVDGEPAGLVLGMPDFNPAIRATPRPGQAVPPLPGRTPAKPNRAAGDRGTAAIPRPAHRGDSRSLALSKHRGTRLHEEHVLRRERFQRPVTRSGRGARRRGQDRAAVLRQTALAQADSE